MRFLVWILSSCLMFAPIAAEAEPTKLERGKRFRVELTGNIDSQRPNDIPELLVYKDVKDREGRVLIEAGEPVEMRTRIKKRRPAGLPGEIYLVVDGVRAVDGSYVELEGGLQEQGKRRVGLAVGLALGLGVLLWPMVLFLLKRGGGSSVRRGETFAVKVTEDVAVDVPAAGSVSAIPAAGASLN